MGQFVTAILTDAAAPHFQAEDAHTAADEMIGQANHVRRRSTAAEAMHDHHAGIARPPAFRQVLVQGQLVAIVQRQPVQDRARGATGRGAERQHRLQVASADEAVLAKGGQIAQIR